MKKILSFFLILLVILIIVPNVYASEVSNDSDVVSDETNTLEEDNANIDAQGKSNESSPLVKYYKGKVFKVEDIDNQGDSYLGERMQIVDVEIINGPFAGRIYTIENYLPDNEALSFYVKKGDKVVLYSELTENQEEIENIYISDYYRMNQLRNLLILFFILLIVIGGIKGLKAIVSLTLTALGIMYFLIPYLLKGYSPIFLTIVLCIVVTVITIIVLNGFTIKSSSTIIGTLSGVIIAGIISYIVGSLTKLTGLSSQEALMLNFIPQGIKFDFRGILFAGILVGALGAVMDVAMSISSSMDELRVSNPYITPEKLIKSGFNVGRDIMGTMSNTLILAYAGSTIPLLLLFRAYDSNMMQILNLDLIATEIVRALSGSIGLLLSIPITAIVYGYIYKRKSSEY